MSPLDIKDESEGQQEVEQPLDKKAKRLAELRRRRESGEVSREDYNTNELQWLIADDEPLTATDLGDECLVLTPEEFQNIGLFDVLRSNGERMTLDPDDFPKDDILIIYPSDLGG